MGQDDRTYRGDPFMFSLKYGDDYGPVVVTFDNDNPLRCAMPEVRWPVAIRHSQPDQGHDE